MDIKTFVKVASNIPADISLLIRGPHGIGKSQLAQQVANNLSLPIIDRRLAQMTEGDIVGLPELVDGVTRFAPVDWILRACREPVVLLMDEINRATVEVMQCAFQLVLDRELNGNKLHPETRIICAVNASADYQVNEMDPALLDRFWVVDLEPTREDWVEWARDRVDDVIIDFINHYPAHLRHVGQIEPGKVYPTPRSYDRLDRTLKAADMDPECWAGDTAPDGFYALCTGFIGVEASLALRDFVTNYDLQISAEDVLDKWKDNESRITKLKADKKNGLVEKIVEHCRNNEWSATQARNVSKFTNTLPGEILVSLFNQVMETGNIPNIRSLHKFIGMKVVQAVTASEKLT